MGHQHAMDTDQPHSSAIQGQDAQVPLQELPLPIQTVADMQTMSGLHCDDAFLDFSDMLAAESPPADPESAWFQTGHPQRHAQLYSSLFHRVLQLEQAMHQYSFQNLQLGVQARSSASSPNSQRDTMEDEYPADPFQQSLNSMLNLGVQQRQALQAIWDALQVWLFVTLPSVITDCHVCVDLSSDHH